MGPEVGADDVSPPAVVTRPCMMTWSSMLMDETPD
jgi:hypothetical protein